MDDEEQSGPDGDRGCEVYEDQRYVCGCEHHGEAHGDASVGEAAARGEGRENIPRTGASRPRPNSRRTAGRAPCSGTTSIPLWIATTRSGESHPRARYARRAASETVMI